MARSRWLKRLLVLAREEGWREAHSRWLECAIYDATIEGPVFKAWNRSSLDCLRLAVELNQIVMTDKQLKEAITDAMVEGKVVKSQDDEKREG